MQTMQGGRVCLSLYGGEGVPRVTSGQWRGEEAYVCLCVPVCVCVWEWGLYVCLCGAPVEDEMDWGGFICWGRGAVKAISTC